MHAQNTQGKAHCLSHKGGIPLGNGDQIRVGEDQEPCPVQTEGTENGDDQTAPSMAPIPMPTDSAVFRTREEIAKARLDITRMFTLLSI